jgi:hypothetical protein
MQEQTREILHDSMVREWVFGWAGTAGLRPDGYSFTGTASAAVDDFRRRFPFIPVRGERLVMDDGDWTIRATFADGSVAVLFAG